MRIVVRRREVAFDFDDEAEAFDLEYDNPRVNADVDEEDILVSLALESWREGAARGVALPFPWPFAVGVSPPGDDEGS